MSAAALRTGPRSGSFERVIGVGTQTKIDVGVGEARGARLDDAEAAGEGGREALVRDVVDRRVAGRELRDARAVGVDALDLEAGLA